MAIDTADKRGSAAGVGLPPGVTMPLPDGSIDAGDRAHLAGLYSGLAAGEPPADSGTPPYASGLWLYLTLSL